MSFVMDVFVYILVWWLLLFTVLPFAITPHNEPGHGYDAGAPAKPNIKKKFIINSLISLVVVGIIHYLVASGIINWDAYFMGDVK